MTTPCYPCHFLISFCYSGMTRVREFVINFPIGGHSATKILVEVDKTFGIKAMSRTQVYQIIKDVREEIDMTDL